MKDSNFSLANRKQLADMLADNKYDGLRSKARNRFREKRQALYQKFFDESAEKKGALKLVQQIDAARKEVEDLENQLLKLGFQANYGALSTRGDAGNILHRQIEARIDKELGTSSDIDARFDSAQIAMMTVATLEDAKKLFDSVSAI